MSKQRTNRCKSLCRGNQGHSPNIARTLGPVLRCVALFLTTGWASGVHAQIPAFPGAEGFGAYAQGGRGGDVYYVTNTNDDGAGSLRNGIATATGPRTIVFAVSGLIQLQSNLKVDKPYITIAGQTAPGDGICLRDYPLLIQADHVIVRFIRSRLGDEGGQESDAISITSGHNIIMDHCSAAWSVDEVFSCSTGDPDEIDNVTVQWSIIAEGLGDSIHSKGYHSYGALIRGCYGAKYTYHHNLFAHNNGRNPRPGNYNQNTYILDPEGLQFDFRNNVVYNWGGSKPSYDADTDSVCRMNYVSNYFKAGLNSSYGHIYDTGSKHFRAYYEGNYFNGAIPTDQYSLVDFGGWNSTEINNWIQSVPFSTGPMITQTAQEAYADVLDHVGASLVRDSVDLRIINDVINGTGTIIDDEDEVGGWPVYHTYNVPTDTDWDGMPDAWEDDKGLDRFNPADTNDDRNDDGYTNLEEYLNWLPLKEPDDNQPPIVQLDPNVVVWLGMSGTPEEETIDLIPVNVSDDGLPDPPARVTLTWTVQEAPDGAQVTVEPNEHVEDPTVTITMRGIYEFRLTADDGDKQGYDTVRIIVGTNPCDASHMSTGDPYNPWDQNTDCFVDLMDFALFALNWLDCTDTLTNCGL